jgi:transcriptional regulator with XRE-family HTH domain
MVVSRVRDAVEVTEGVDDLNNLDSSHALGIRVRELRKANGLSLQRLADSVGISVGYLSEIERDISRVPIPVLRRIADRLGVHLHWFFDGGDHDADNEHDIVVRAGRGRRLSFPGIGISDELLSPDLLGPLEVIRSTLAPGADSEVYTHEGVEAGTVLSGVLDLWVDERHLRLGEGDTFTFASTIPHRCANTTDSPTVVLWIVTPPHY